jgi:hypothetical protein
VLDTTAPAAPSITGPASPGKARNPSWTLSAEPGAAIDCRLDQGGTQVFGWTACSSPLTADLPLGADGTYTLSGRSRDAAGIYRKRSCM